MLILLLGFPSISLFLHLSFFFLSSLCFLLSLPFCLPPHPLVYSFPSLTHLFLFSCSLPDTIPITRVACTHNSQLRAKCWLDGMRIIQRLNQLLGYTHGLKFWNVVVDADDLDVVTFVHDHLFSCHWCCQSRTISHCIDLKLWLCACVRRFCLVFEWRMHLTSFL